MTGIRDDRTGTAPDPAGVVEVACDESGSEGEKLVGGCTDVFAHASVGLDPASAAACVREARARIGSPAQEYKSGHLLRDKHRPVLTWFLGAAGPLGGRAHVHLTDKAFLVVARVVEVLLDGVPGAGVSPDLDPRARDVAVALYREGPRAFGPDRWLAFLEASNELLRTRNRWGEHTSVDAFFQVVDDLRPGGARGEAADIVALLRRGRAHADAFWARLLGDPAMIPALDPQIPAIVRAVRHWGGGGRPVAIVHDQQTALTEERIARLKELLGAPGPEAPGSPPGGGRLTSLRLVDSRSDPRVQVADFLAGVARKIASDELNGHGDAELTALVRPYVDRWSVWGDARSWSLLGPAPP